MKNKFISITFNDLANSMQQQISKLLAKEVCLRMKTPAYNDPCSDESYMEKSVQQHLNNFGNDPLFDLDIEEVGKEAGILK